MTKLKKYKSKLRRVEFNSKVEIINRYVHPGDDKVMLCTKGNGYSLKDDKLKYPSIFNSIFELNITVSPDIAPQTVTLLVKEQLPFSKTRDYRYRWNNADIVGPLKMFCSPDDRRIILASGIHDFLLEYREENYKPFQELGYSKEEFIRLTSDVFTYLCIQGGFGKARATVMGNIVDWFQLHCQKKKWSFDWLNAFFI